MRPYRNRPADTRTKLRETALGMIEDLFKAIAQIGDPRSRGQLLAAIGASVAVLVVLVATLWQLLHFFAASGYGWFDMVVQGAGLFGAGMLAWFAFPLVVSSTLGFFTDELCDAVEARYYPSLPPARHQSLAESLREGMSFAGLALLLNILVLPLYLLPGPNILIYLALNGWLLGREYFDAVALRRKTPGELAALRRQLRPGIWLAGVLIAFSLTIPFINLVVPLLGVAFMTHRFHHMTKPPNFNL